MYEKINASIHDGGDKVCFLRVNGRDFDILQLVSLTEKRLTLTHIPGSPAKLYRPLVSLVRVILQQTGMFELQHREERDPFTQITN